MWRAAGGETNQRNGGTAKTVLTGDGKQRIATPRDGNGSFVPLLLPRHARRFPAFDDSIVALYTLFTPGSENPGVNRVYTTNAIESVMPLLRKISRTRGYGRDRLAQPDGLAEAWRRAQPWQIVGSRHIAPDNAA